MTTHYQWTVKLETAKEYPSKWCRTVDPISRPCTPSFDVDLDDLERVVKQVAYHRTVAVFHGEFAKKGIDVTILDYDIQTDISLRTESKQFRDYSQFRHWATLKATVTIDFSSERSDLLASPIDPVTGAILIKIVEILVGALVTAVIAIFVIEALKKWLQSMTTVQYHKITKYDEEGNIISVEEWGTEPSLIGIAGVGSIFIILVVILLFFMIGRRK